MADLIKHFRWERVSIVYTDDAYGKFIGEKHLSQSKSMLMSLEGKRIQS